MKLLPQHQSVMNCNNDAPANVSVRKEHGCRLDVRIYRSWCRCELGKECKKLLVMNCNSNCNLLRKVYTLTELPDCI